VVVPGRGAHLHCSYDAIGAFREIAEALGCAVAVTPDAKGLFPEDHPVPSHLLGTSERWAAVLGRTVADGANGDNAAINADPAVPGSRIAFHRVPEGKTVKNRMHFDLITTDFDAEVDRLTGLGATKLNEINAGSHWATLADPEGNEFDVIAG